MARAEFREHDPFSPITYCYSDAQLLHEEATPWQKLAVLEHPYFGRMLVLDGVVQLTERDEYFYHEMLVHVALHAHPRPRDVLIIGGGDGGSLRQTLKHRAVKRATIVEIDRRVIEVAKEFFPGLASSFDEPRATAVQEDGAEFLRARERAFDVIIIDSTDPVGPAESLFTPQFFAKAATALKDDGMFVAQTESLHFHLDFVTDVQRKLKDNFPIVDLYTQSIATYAGNWWTFSIGSKRYDPRVPRRKVTIPTQYYSADVHRWSFLPRSVYDSLMATGSFR